RCYRLSQRDLLAVRGPDSVALLQGLVTNDVELLRPGGAAGTGEGGRRALYAHLLNVQGRTVADLLLYRQDKAPGQEVSILLECDQAALDMVQKHLKMYKIRKKVQICACPELAVWAVLPAAQPGEASRASPSGVPEDWILTPDPRTAAMGWRLVVEREVKPVELVPGWEQGELEEYHRHRYRLGLAEGVRDLPPGVALPLESNLVYMNGISFSKGCYLGQELTARTHYTGLIRKRLLPVRLSGGALSAAVPAGAEILSESEKPAGKYRAGEGELGLALVRLAHAREQLRVETADGTRVELAASVPMWWPGDGEK
uniref:Iron-sulfur cluster assembly factor IBA57, mitochondrial n=2 Tax=Latimeria chalumnae TaxID=7897 RepID=H2ZXG7_LATCH